jgi:serine/threonine protein kinase
MSFDQTQIQGAEEQLLSQELSLQRWRPPIDVPGYEPRRFLGAGAYGEVWVAIDRNTGRQVAIKFYLHRGGLDWSLLSREVEKLAFLSADRYVVQLLDVGWDATPPYYVMEYVEHGSLEDRVKSDGPLPADQAAALFREVCVGLVHAHGKGVLHCDLKPANILLDQDRRPRIADFGQSRLSHEQTPALGTLFFMAPEQADLQATPDARWDVYALGAVMYWMLTGAPPYRRDRGVSGDDIAAIEQADCLDERLSRYRGLIAKAPAPSEHRRMAGVDRPLADIVDRCLAADPRKRFANAQAVLHALDERQRRRARRPLIALGALGPAVLLALVALMAWRWFTVTLDHSSSALTERALESLGFAADSVATVAADELARRFEAVERIASDEEFIGRMTDVQKNAELKDTLVTLADPNRKDQELEPMRVRIRRPAESEMEEKRDPRFEEIANLDSRLRDLAEGESDRFDAASWFATDPLGVQLVRTPPSNTTGENYSWRTYFHGGDTDQPRDWRPPPEKHVDRTRLSAVYRSASSQDWSVAVSTPVMTPGPDREFLGVVAVSFRIGTGFLDLQNSRDRFAVLIDTREGDRQGLVLQHPLYDELDDTAELEKYRVPKDRVHSRIVSTDDYRDIFASHSKGERFGGRWLAAQRPVEVRGRDTGWVVVVQESYDHAIGGAVEELRSAFLSTGLLTLAGVAIVIGGLWAFVVRGLSAPRRRKTAGGIGAGSSSLNSPLGDISASNGTPT